MLWVRIDSHENGVSAKVLRPAAGSGASTTGCTMPCGGASDEQCGNGYKSSLYTYVPSLAKSMGCYIDSGNPRLLPSYSFSSSSMTPTLCQSTCMGKGYTFSGQCYVPLIPGFLLKPYLPSLNRCLVCDSMLLLLECAACDREDSRL